MPVSILETISIQDLYVILVQLVDLTRHVRKHAIVEVKRPRRNKSLKAVPPSHSNVGGLVSISFPKEIIPVTIEELDLLEEIQEHFINMKNSLLQSQPLPRRFITPSKRGESELNKSERNKHFSHFRKNKHRR
jgi:hypothetical protein